MGKRKKGPSLGLQRTQEPGLTPVAQRLKAAKNELANKKKEGKKEVT